MNVTSLGGPSKAMMHPVRTNSPPDQTTAQCKGLHIELHESLSVSRGRLDLFLSRLHSTAFDFTFGSGPFQATHATMSQCTQ